MTDSDLSVNLGYNDVSIWDSKAEQEVFIGLQEMIAVEHYCIFPHMPISEVFKAFRKYEVFKDTYVKYCELVSEAGQMDKHFELLHFDFVIYRKISYLPVLIIEADGSRHKTKQSTIFFDKFKDYIALQYEVPLVRLELYNPDIDIKEKLKKKLRDKDLNDPYNYPIYCRKCGKRLIYRPKGLHGSFYFCRDCKKEGTDKSLTLSNNKENCPSLFAWDR